MKTNKEIMDALTAHFLKSDPKDIARAFANTILDIHRLMIFDLLPVNEQICLQERLKLNEKEFLLFVKEGARKDGFKIIDMNSDEK